MIMMNFMVKILDANLREINHRLHISSVQILMRVRLNP